MGNKIGNRLKPGLGTPWMRQNAERLQQIRPKGRTRSGRKRRSKHVIEDLAVTTRPTKVRAPRKRRAPSRDMVKTAAFVPVLRKEPPKRLRSKEEELIRAAHLRYLVIQKLDKTRADEFGIIRRGRA